MGVTVHGRDLSYYVEATSWEGTMAFVIASRNADVARETALAQVEGEAEITKCVLLKHGQRVVAERAIAAGKAWDGSDFRQNR